MECNTSENYSVAKNDIITKNFLSGNFFFRQNVANKLRAICHSTPLIERSERIISYDIETQRRIALCRFVFYQQITNFVIEKMI